MTTKVAQMTTDELRELIGSVVEEKLVELLGNPVHQLDLPDFLDARRRRREQTAPTQAAVVSLDGLLARITEANLHQAVETGPAVGAEAW